MAEPVGVLRGRSGVFWSGSGWIGWKPDPLSRSGLDIISRCLDYLCIGCELAWSVPGIVYCDIKSTYDLLIELCNNLLSSL